MQRSDVKDISFTVFVWTLLKRKIYLELKIFKREFQNIKILHAVYSAAKFSLKITQFQLIN